MTTDLHTIINCHHCRNMGDLIHRRNICGIRRCINIDPLKVGVVLRQLGNDWLDRLARTARGRGEKIHCRHSLLPRITLLVSQSLNGFSQSVDRLPLRESWSFPDHTPEHSWFSSVPRSMLPLEILRPTMPYSPEWPL